VSIFANKNRLLASPHTATTTMVAAAAAAAAMTDTVAAVVAVADVNDLNLLV
jgi:hypothetical protein